jgi:hypothetical protein
MKPLFRGVRRLLLCGAAFCIAGIRAWADQTGAIDAFDVYPAVACPLGVDRASKILIVSAANGQRINREMADEIVLALMSSGEFRKGLGLSLRQGDYRLGRAMHQLLLNLGVANREAEDLLWRIASPDSADDARIDGILSAAALQPACRGALLDYMLRTPEGYPAFVAGLDSFWSQRGQRISRLLWQRFEPALKPDEWNAVLGGDVAVRWKLNELLEPELLRPNVFSPMLQEQDATAESSPYRLFWGRWIARLDADPALVQEMVARLRGATFVYDALQATLSESLAEHGQPLLAQYMAASEIPQSRYDRVVRLLFGKKGTALESDEMQGHALKTWAQLVGGDREWCGYLLWHLTRPAGSLGAVTLHALSEQLAGNAELAQAAFTVLDDRAGTRPDVLSLAEDDAKGFLLLKAGGKLTTADWLQYGARVGALIEERDDLAREALADPKADVFFERSLGLSLQSSAAMATAWAETMLRSDSLVRQRFVAWAVQGGTLKEASQATAWLQAVATPAKDGISPQAGQFRQVWISWLKTIDGKEAVRQRLSLEIWGVPREVRDLLAKGWLRNPAGFLAWRTMAVHLPEEKAGILGRDSLVLLREPNFIQACLAAARVGNLAVGDSIAPVWRTMFLRPDGELVEAFQKEFTGGALLGQPYLADALALADAVDKVPDQVDQALARVNLSGYAPGPAGRQHFQKALFDAGAEVRPLVADLLKDKAVWNTWRNSLFSAVLFAGKGAAAAELVSKDSGLEEIWANELGAILVSDADGIPEIMNGLAKQAAGDLGYADQVAKWSKSLMNATAADPYFFEQICADPTGGYQAQIDALSRRFLATRS